MVWRVVAIHLGLRSKSHLNVTSLSSVVFERQIGLGGGESAKRGKVTGVGLNIELAYNSKD